MHSRALDESNLRIRRVKLGKQAKKRDDAVKKTAEGNGQPKDRSVNNAHYSHSYHTTCHDKVGRENHVMQKMWAILIEI